MNIPDLKVDPELPYHYIVGLALNISKELFGSQTYQLKYLYRFTNDDVERLRKAVMMSSDKVFKTTQKEALEMFDCSEIVHAIASMKVAISVNMGTLHHFSSKEPLDDSYFESLIELLPKSEEIKERFRDSRIG